MGIFPTSTPHFQPPTTNPSLHKHQHSANPGNVVGGHKANLNNPNTSDESKQHSKEVLQEIENGGDANAVSSSGGDKNPNNVAGGLKATLNNPNTSDEAKQSARRGSARSKQLWSFDRGLDA